MNGSLTVLGWVEDAAALMRAATVLVTKPGGLTTAEAAVCGTPMVLFDPIPGPEERNAERVAQAGAGVLAGGTAETVSAVTSLLDNERKRNVMAARARDLGSPAAAATVADLVREARDSARGFRAVILTIRNGAGHTKAADAVAAAIELRRGAGSVTVVDVADYMSFAARLTHVDLYLWLVKHAPALWDRIDRYQKRQRHTSPEWYYRRGCRWLFDFVQRAQPDALVATEVGCLEIAALIKRDLALDCPLVAVNGEYDAERSWVQPEVDLYTVPREEVRGELAALGAPPSAIRAWGVPLAPEFAAPINRVAARASACLRLDLDRDRPIVLVSGGSEGLGRPDAIAERVLRIKGLDIQVVVLAGRNEALRRRCMALPEWLGGGGRLRVLGWTSAIRELMEAADVIVSKPGHTFDEAIATELPMVVLPPPPGSEEVQYRLLGEWGVGRGVRTIEEMVVEVTRLLTDADARESCRASAERRRNPEAANRIAQWVERYVAAGERETRFGEERSA
jgi:processive 1,2-diacylglycerol beta-glucosyltransferase